MLRLNKKTEYALLAMRFMARGAAGLVSVRTIALHYNIPEMLLAKVLQRMKKTGLVRAVKGAGGGYELTRELDAIPLVDVLGLFDDKTQLVSCIGDDHDGCDQLVACDIRGPLAVLHEAMMVPLRSMSVADLFEADQKRARPRRLSIYR